MEYVFTLKYQLASDDRNVDDIIERLGAAGCDDALVGIGLPGRLAMTFTREADSAQNAICSALADVRGALPAARIIEAAPDLVGLTDVAELVGVSRQNMRKLMLTHSNSFPTPVHDGSTALWHLTDLLEWLQSRGGYDISQSMIDVAQMTLQVNVLKCQQRASRRMTAALRGLVCR